MNPILHQKRQVVAYVPYRIMQGGMLEYFLQRRDEKAQYHSGIYSLFGGGIESNETLTEALMREVHEELRYVPSNAHYLALCSSGYGDFFTFIEEVDLEFERNIDIHEGVGGVFLTYQAICEANDISPIARVATETAHWYLNKLQTNYKDTKYT